MLLEIEFLFGGCPFGFSVLNQQFRAIFQYLGANQKVLEQRTNKQFKSDSARVALLLCVGFSD
ncbi:hypothetical protein BBM61_06640 [Vibrio parahaemolyticus]|uniref:DUF4372 domain-containing protein n=1 Tax=Vibrio parahaemolyticus TaxID=670 RepID=A0AAX0MIH7_VIBPH|nr:hypothetical protein VP10329_14270 [Vibrio parahaemolyticus 10329]EGR0963597.1 hypothetical protein [Vibrio parahaemolyticus]EQL88378.1 hypothetical protein D052_3298 [Vibrio parahaemolyticus 10290]ESV69670.1 hypothetical protein D021_1153 [Vibrio parahaemolyticus 10296]ESW41650.1 hypothetical protein D022_4914 [Vibrio parahaemolyticus 12310]ETT14213.1 hypothetical protein D023_4839 [Vibrio parahaemolyticus 3256]ETX54267.1 hypothetical protein D020_2545 [Vibrio parahaemolyticus SBR10290]E